MENILKQFKTYKSQDETFGSPFLSEVVKHLSFFTFSWKSFVFVGNPEIDSQCVTEYVNKNINYSKNSQNNFLPKISL